MDKTVVLMCSGKKCCPQVTLHEDGSLTLIDTDDGKNERIHLNPEQAALLKEQLATR